jgi:hypothetical protein
MTRQPITILIVTAASVLAVSVGRAAQDRFALKSPNGIAFSEFKGYEAWPLIATSQPDNAGGCGTSKDACMKAIVGNPAMIRAYAAGFPANGKAVPDGAAMAKIEWHQSRNAAAPYAVTVPGPQAEVAFMVKDAKRFPDTNGWGYATFQYNAASDTYKPATSDPSVMKSLCHGCHTAGAKARDYVYTSYATR